MDAGDLVPSDVTNRMVEARVAEPDAANGFVLDGYPRTVDQGDALKKILEHNGTALDAVVAVRVTTTRNPSWVSWRSIEVLG